MKATYSEAEEIAYANGVLDAMNLMDEELVRLGYEFTYEDMKQVQAAVMKRLCEC